MRKLIRQSLLTMESSKLSIFNGLKSTVEDISVKSNGKLSRMIYAAEVQKTAVRDKSVDMVKLIPRKPSDRFGNDAYPIGGIAKEAKDTVYKLRLGKRRRKYTYKQLHDKKVLTENEYFRSGDGCIMQYPSVVAFDFLHGVVAKQFFVDYRVAEHYYNELCEKYNLKTEKEEHINNTNKEDEQGTEAQVAIESSKG